MWRVSIAADHLRTHRVLRQCSTGIGEGSNDCAEPGERLWGSWYSWRRRTRVLAIRAPAGEKIRVRRPRALTRDERQRNRQRRCRPRCPAQWSSTGDAPCAGGKTPRLPAPARG
jgi:hypothetical protein